MAAALALVGPWGSDLPTRRHAKESRPVFHQGRIMSAICSIAPDKLSRLIGTATCPVLVDVRIGEDFEADPHFIPGSTRRSHAAVAEWASSLSGQTVVVICRKG